MKSNLNHRKMVGCALGHETCSLAVSNAQLVNVLTGEIYPVDIGIWDKWVAYIQPAGKRKIHADRVINANGQFLSPGLIDTHVHIESSMLTPAHFASAVLPHGTTTVIIDPHEIANVLGLEGVQYFLDASEHLPLKVFVLAPSCVPAVPKLETAGAIFGVDEIREMLSWDRVIGLAEVMDYPGVIGVDDRMLSILNVARDKNVLICGHCPQLSGFELQAYMAVGPDSDHEVMAMEEMKEKIRSGMTIEAHESFHSSNIEALVNNLVNLPLLPPNVTFCIDDLPAQSLMEDGHIDRVLRSAVSYGLNPVIALRLATLHAAMRNRLYNLGLVAPGKLADLVLFNDLIDFEVDLVVCDGRVVVEDGNISNSIASFSHPVEKKMTVNISKRPTIEDFQIRSTGIDKKVNVIDYVDGVTSRFHVQEISIKDGTLDWMSDSDICLVAVFERHGKGGNISLGLVKGIGLRFGAIASTVAHDSHNLITVGRNIDDMVLAVNTLIDVGGGLVCTNGNKVLEMVKLPVAGLLSLLPPVELAKKLSNLKKVVESLGMAGREPLLNISVLALPVVPEARISDLGLVDVKTQTFKSLFIE